MAAQSPEKMTTAEKVPPERSRGIVDDFRQFFLNKPAQATLINFASPQEKVRFSQRIMQRIGLDVSAYSMLNLHRIGIEAPVQLVFEELLSWSGDSTCWPNHIARVQRAEGKIENIRVLLLGMNRLPFGMLSPLFEMNAIRIQRTPSEVDSDNSRYLLYRCSGGYPMGIFTLFLRSSIASEQETHQSQLFAGVGFDFYGVHALSRVRPVSRAWEKIHDRVTSNILNRFRQLCEWRFEQLQLGEGLKGRPVDKS